MEDKNLYLDQSKDWTLKELDIPELPRGEVSFGSLNFFSDAAHRITNVPVMAARGQEDGPTLGLIAVVHGNELNGIMTIHELFDRIDPTNLQGNVIAIPVVNMHGYLTKQRNFIDSKDLNRAMPGKPKGKPSEVFAHRFLKRVINKFDYMLDIHTASFGRVNSHYVRADLSDPKATYLAKLQDAQIVVNTKKPGGSFRYAANKIGVPAITIELGNPQLFQKSMVSSGVEGIENVMIDLDMIAGNIKSTNQTIFCKKSYWVRVDMGGILYVYPDLVDHIEKGEEIAKLNDMFGRRVKNFYAPENGFVVGKSTNPVTYTGGRILHLGIPGDIDDLSDEDNDEEDEEDDY